MPRPRAAAKMHHMASIRPALEADLPAIVGLFADDDEAHAPGAYAAPGVGQREALAAIEADPNNAVYVAELDGVVLGTFQLTFIRQLSYGGCLVAQIESVHVHSSARGQGIGALMMAFAIEQARRRGALRVQLTSNVRRTRAHEFYERLGFRASHKGMKLYLDRG
ncbi:MAG TPA: GNAT family N-acetyltransferase [Polyangiaceae bacterium]